MEPGLTLLTRRLPDVETMHALESGDPGIPVRSRGLRSALLTGPRAPVYTVKGGHRGAQTLLKGRAAHSGAMTFFRLENWY